MSIRRRISIATITLALVFSAQLATAKSQQKSPTTDTTEIVDTVKALFADLSNDDLTKFNSLVTPNFYMYDGGQRFTSESIVALIKAEQAAGKHYEWNVTQPDVHVTGNAAWIAYVNRRHRHRRLRHPAPQMVGISLPHKECGPLEDRLLP